MLGRRGWTVGRMARWREMTTQAWEKVCRAYPAAASLSQQEVETAVGRVEETVASTLSVPASTLRPYREDMVVRYPKLLDEARGDDGVATMAANLKTLHALYADPLGRDHPSEDVVGDVVRLPRVLFAPPPTLAASAAALETCIHMLEAGQDLRAILPPSRGYAVVHKSPDALRKAYALEWLLGRKGKTGDPAHFATLGLPKSTRARARARRSDHAGLRAAWESGSISHADFLATLKRIQVPVKDPAATANRRHQMTQRKRAKRAQRAQRAAKRAQRAQ